jgi:hypothetical protein
MRFARALVVGGSGMLAGCCRSLLAVYGTVSVLARDERRIRAIAPQIVPFVCDYCDEIAVLHALEDRSFDLVIAWIHGRAPDLRRLLANRVSPGGRFIQVLGSAHGDPSHPDRLEEMRAAAAGLPVTYQAVVLGFILDGTRARWLTDGEISQGVFAAVESGAPFSIVGTVEPWSARP